MPPEVGRGVDGDGRGGRWHGGGATIVEEGLGTGVSIVEEHLGGGASDGDRGHDGGSHAAEIWSREGRRRGDGGSEGPTCGTHMDEVAADALSDEGGFHGSGKGPFLRLPAQVE
jgi:hypothetical protein